VQYLNIRANLEIHDHGLSVICVSSHSAFDGLLVIRISSHSTFDTVVYSGALYIKALYLKICHFASAEISPTIIMKGGTIEENFIRKFIYRNIRKWDYICL